MDPISTAIMAALATGVVGKAAESGNNVPTVEAYNALKTALRQKYGATSDLVDAVEKLEKKPTSVGRKEVLKEEVAAAKADEDRDLLAIVHTLLDDITTKLGAQPPGDKASPLHLQRPTPTGHFVGRKEELAQLLATLQPGQIVALCGPEGVGKSTLAAEAVWKLAPGNAPPDGFPDGIIYHSFYTQPRVDIALEQIARTFEEELVPTPYDAAQRALLERQALLVLDGAEHADDLHGILAMRGGCGVLVTGREPLDTAAGQVTVGPLPSDEAVTLLQSWWGAQAGSPAAARRICELVGNLPLAIRLAGRYIAASKEPPNDYLAWLESTSLAQAKPKRRLKLSAPLLLEHTVARLSDVAQETLQVVGLMALTPFDQEAVAEVLANESNQGFLSSLRRIFRQQPPENQPADIGLAMVELVDYGLLRSVEQGFEVSHPLIYSYIQEHLPAPIKTLRRLATYYVGLTWEQSGLGVEGQAVLDANRPHFMRVLAKCLEAEDWEAAHGLAVAVEDYLDLQGYAAERIVANEIGLMAAWKLGRTNEAAWMGNLGDTYRTMGQAKWAIEHFEKALAVARQLGDWQSEANCLGNLGLAYRDLGDVTQAQQYLKESHAIFEELQSPKATLVKDWLAELEDWDDS